MVAIIVPLWNPLPAAVPSPSRPTPRSRPRRPRPRATAVARPQLAILVAIGVGALVAWAVPLSAVVLVWPILFFVPGWVVIRRVAPTCRCRARSARRS